MPILLLDENISHRIAEVLNIILANLDTRHVEKWFGAGLKDPEWMTRYGREVDESGNPCQFFISGDRNILREKAERKAITDNNLIGALPKNARQFDRLHVNEKTAFLLLWTPYIVEEMQHSRPGTILEFPINWSPKTSSVKRIP